VFDPFDVNKATGKKKQYFTRKQISLFFFYH
jgi:hypothetical protein